jgi:hypothetical protein
MGLTPQYRVALILLKSLVADLAKLYSISRWALSSFYSAFLKMKRACALSGILLILIVVGFGCSNNATDIPATRPTQHYTTEPDPESISVPASPAAVKTRMATFTRLSDLVATILSQPDSYLGQQVEIVGYFRGWNLLKEVKGSSPVTRSDWVIADQSGAIYVTGIIPPNLDPASLQDMDKLVRLVATVGQNQNGVYLQAVSVEVISTE